MEWFVALATALIVGAAGVATPLYNWDLINYVASAYAWEGLTGRPLSDRVYGDVAAEVGPNVFGALTQGDYRATVHGDPEALRQQMPIVRIRVVYLGLMRLLHAAGATYPQATYLVSAAAASAAVLVLGLICRSLGLSLFVVPLVVVSCGYVRLARLSTPDAITCLATLLMVWLVLTRRPAAHAVAAVLPLVRTDFVLLSMLAAAYGWLDGRRTTAVASAFVAVSLYLGLDTMNGGYGWRTLVNVTFIGGAHPYPKTMPLATGVRPYVDAYLRGAWSILRHPHVFIYGAAVGVLWPTARRRTLPREQLAILVIMMAFVASHWVLFPVYGERFFSAPASAVLLVVLAHLSGAAPALPGGDARREAWQPLA